MTMRKFEKKDGVEYTVSEAELAAKTQEMEPYHRELMFFLVARVKEMEAAGYYKKQPVLVSKPVLAS